MAVTVSATALPAAVVNHMVEHTQAIEPHAVIEIQETEQISLPENSAGIALIKTPTIRGNNDVDPVILTGDFGKVVKLKSERSLTDNEIYLLHMFVKNFELDIIKRRWFLGLCPLVNIIIRPPPFQIPVSAPETYCKASRPIGPVRTKLRTTPTLSNLNPPPPPPPPHMLICIALVGELTALPQHPLGGCPPPHPPREDIGPLGVVAHPPGRTELSTLSTPLYYDPKIRPS